MVPTSHTSPVHAHGAPTRHKKNKQNPLQCTIPSRCTHSRVRRHLRKLRSPAPPRAFHCSGVRQRSDSHRHSSIRPTILRPPPLMTPCAVIQNETSSADRTQGRTGLRQHARIAISMSGAFVCVCVYIGM